jgi:hypothetical protein
MEANRGSLTELQKTGGQEMLCGVLLGMVRAPFAINAGLRRSGWQSFVDDMQIPLCPGWSRR